MTQLAKYKHTLIFLYMDREVSSSILISFVKISWENGQYCHFLSTNEAPLYLRHYQGNFKVRHYLNIIEEVMIIPPKVKTCSFKSVFTIRGTLNFSII